MTLQAAGGSALACLGVSGYVIGLALPVSPGLDLPLVFLVALAVLAAIASPQQRRLGDSLVALPLLAFVAARLASALAAPEPLRSLKMVAPVLPGLLLFFVLSEWVRTEHHVAVVYVSLTAAGLVLATTFLVMGWLSAAGSADAWAQAMPSPLLVVKNDLAVVAVLAPVALAAARLRPRWLVRLLVLGFFAALVTAIGAMQSRTVLLTALVAVGGFAALTRGRALVAHPRRAWLLLAAAVAGVIAVDALLGFRLAQKILGDAQGSGRLALWAAALAMFQAAPVLGHGPHSFVLHYRAYLDTMQLPGWVVIDPRVTPWAHNLFLELLAEQGAVGLAAFLALVATGIATTARLLRADRRNIRCLGAGAGAALIAFLAAALVELTLLRAWVIIVLFTLLGLLVTATRVEREDSA